MKGQRAGGCGRHGESRTLAKMSRANSWQLVVPWLKLASDANGKRIALLRRIFSVGGVLLDAVSDASPERA
ncbi:unnamed protein product [Lota lota]